MLHFFSFTCSVYFLFNGVASNFSALLPLFDVEQLLGTSSLHTLSMASLVLPHFLLPVRMLAPTVYVERVVPLTECSWRYGQK